MRPYYSCRFLQAIVLQFMLVLFLCFYNNYAYSQIKQLDKSTLEEMTEDRTEDGAEFNVFLSHSTNYISLGIPVSLFVAGAIRHDINMKQKALFIGESIVISTVVTTALKNAVRRPRPFVNNPAIIPADAAGSFSFPSGHASEAFSTATSLAIAYPKWYVIAPAYLWAGSVAYSRMYLGVHYPSDILAGAITGAGSAWLTYKLNKWIQRKHKG
jgi:undecaprenyl-diphosphatase